MSNGIIINKSELEELYDVMKNIYDYEKSVHDVSNNTRSRLNEESNDEGWRLEEYLKSYSEEFHLRHSLEFKYKVKRLLKGVTFSRDPEESYRDIGLQFDRAYLISGDERMPEHDCEDYKTSDGVKLHRIYYEFPVSVCRPIEGFYPTIMTFYKPQYYNIIYPSCNYLKGLVRLLDNIGESGQCIVDSEFLNNINKTIKEYQNG